MRDGAGVPEKKRVGALIRVVYQFVLAIWLCENSAKDGLQSKTVENADNITSARKLAEPLIVSVLFFGVGRRSAVLAQSDSETSVQI
jgi:hypothetical protein